MPFSTTKSTQAVHGSVGSRNGSSRPLPPPSSNNPNPKPSALALHVINNNNQTPAHTSFQALQRAFSSPDQPALQGNHGSTQGIFAAHQAKARAAIDDFDAAFCAAMNGQTNE